MAEPTTTKLKVAASKDDVVAAIKEALPDDAIVRHEDDGVGRFASERTVMIIGTDGDRLMLYRGNWRLIKARENDPQLDVKLKTTKKGVSVRMTSAPEEKASVSSQVMGVVANIATVAILAVAYHMFRDLPVDNAKIAVIGIGGGLGWTAIARMFPSKPTGAGLEKIVRDAVDSLKDDEG